MRSKLASAVGAWVARWSWSSWCILPSDAELTDLRSPAAQRREGADTAAMVSGYNGAAPILSCRGHHPHRPPQADAPSSALAAGAGADAAAADPAAMQ